MGPYSEVPARGEWHMSQENRNCFLKPVRFPREAINGFKDDKTTIGDQCLLQLKGICDSLQHNNVLITESVSFSQKIWDLHVYEDDPSAFPVSNVQIKCNILSTMLDLLRSHRDDDLTGETRDNEAKVLDYLRKLLDAAEFRDNTQPAKPAEVSTPGQPRRGRLSLVSGSPSHRKKSCGPRTNTAFGSPDKDVGIDNISKFHEYKPLIISLHHKLTFLNQSNPNNDIIFTFILRHVCKFIIADCKLLLADYIDREILPT